MTTKSIKSYGFRCGQRVKVVATDKPFGIQPSGSAVFIRPCGTIVKIHYVGNNEPTFDIELDNKQIITGVRWFELRSALEAMWKPTGKIVSFEQFISTWYTRILPNKPYYIRLGQSLMTYLYDVWPAEYERILFDRFYIKKELDCFYLDSIIHRTLVHLGKVWNNYPN